MTEHRDDTLRSEKARKRRELLERILMDNTMSIEEMADALEISTNQARKYARQLRGEDGGPCRIYIADWDVYGQKRMRAVPRYRWMETGREVDAPKPPSEYITKAPRREPPPAPEPERRRELPTFDRDPLLGAMYKRRRDD